MEIKPTRSFFQLNAGGSTGENMMPPAERLERTGEPPKMVKLVSDEDYEQRRLQKLGRIDRSITTTVVAAEPEVDEGPQPL